MRIAALSLFIFCALPLAAQSWERVGPEGGMVISLAADPNGDLVLGTSDGHIFGSSDRGESWKLRGRVSWRTDAVVAQLAVSPKDSRQIFAAVWFREAGAGGGVFRSDDLGTSWRPSGLKGEAVRALEFSPSQPGTLVAGTRSGIFRSPEGGDWERISPQDDPELRNVDSVAIDPANPQLIYAGTYHLPWKTMDGGKTWKPVSAGLIDDSDIMSMRVDASDPARLYISACSGIYRSENRGEVWTKLQGIPYAARRTQAIVQDPRRPALLYAATTEGLWVTYDSGESWERTTPREWIVNGVAVLAGSNGSPGRVIIGTEAQGVLLSDDSGKTFRDANRGFTHQLVKQLVSDPEDPTHLLLVLQRGGVDLQESQDSGKNWSTLPAASAKGRDARDPSMVQIENVYGTAWGWLAQLSDGTLWSYSTERTGWLPWVANITPPVGSGKKSQPAPHARTFRKPRPSGPLAFTLKSTYLQLPEGVLRCNRTGKCELLPAFSKTGPPSLLWVSPDDRVLFVVADGKLGLSRDAGKSVAWRDLPAGARSGNAILSDSQAHSTLLFGTNHGLYSSVDAGEHWSPSQGGLPAGVVEHVWGSASGVVVTLEQGGVYLSPDGLGNWTRLDEDAERSPMTGFSETKPGLLLFGSQSEGLLQWTKIPK